MVSKHFLKMFDLKTKMIGDNSDMHQILLVFNFIFKYIFSNPLIICKGTTFIHNYCLKKLLDVTDPKNKKPLFRQRSIVFDSATKRNPKASRNSNL